MGIVGSVFGRTVVESGHDIAKISLSFGLRAPLLLSTVGAFVCVVVKLAGRYANSRLVPVRRPSAWWLASETGIEPASAVVTIASARVPATL